jgi:hypothetical protein
MEKLINHLRKMIGGQERRQSEQAMQQTSETAMCSVQEQEDLKNATQAYFDEFDKNTISLFFAKNKNDTALIKQYKETEEHLMDKIIKTDNIRDIFEKLLIAEYKERVYESINFPHFEYTEMLHMEEYKRIIIEYYGENTLWEHEHDPTHFMFNDGKHFYMFYEMVEVYGDYILDQLEYE